MSDRTVTQSTEARSPGLARLQAKARLERSLRFNNLLHHITPELLTQAYQHLNKHSARGVDGESWHEFGQHLSERISQLHRALHSQRYKPQAVRRVWIPKLNGEQRPLGVTSVKDNKRANKTPMITGGFSALFYN